METRNSKTENYLADNGMDPQFGRLFADAKTVELHDEEKRSIWAVLQAFMAFYPFGGRKVPTEHEGIFFARFADEVGSLTREEKEEMRARLVAFMEANPLKARRGVFAFIRQYVSILPAPAFALAVFLLIFISSGGVLYATKDTLPGDFLYPVKVVALEEVPSYFAKSAASRVRWEALKAENRLSEAEELAVGGMLDEKTALLITNDLNQRMARIDRWEAEASEDQAALAEGIDESLLRVKALAHASVTLNEALANTEIDIKKAAEDTLKTTETRIAEIRVLVSEAQLPKDVEKEVRKRLRTADRVIVDGRGRLRAGEHKEAYVLFQEGYILATEAEKLIPTESSEN